MKQSVKEILQGLGVGASMTVPGVSGGTMAMILGIYDRLVGAVSGVFKESKKQLPYLLRFAAGAVVGIFLVSGLIARALDSAAGVPLRFAFAGAVAGGVPLIFKKAELKRLNVKSTLLILAGAAAAVLIGQLPEGAFAQQSGLTGILLQLLGGVIVAAALVLPGISASHMMLMLGIYEPVMEHVSRLELLPLLPLAAGVLTGTFVTARVLERLLERHTQGCYLVILGFMAYSLVELAPAGARGAELAVGLACCVIGFAVIRLAVGERAAEENHRNSLSRKGNYHNQCKRSQIQTKADKKSHRYTI